MDDALVAKPGPSKCLKCGKTFQSRDVCTHRICPKCTRANNKEYIPRISMFRIASKDAPLPDIDK